MQDNEGQNESSGWSWGHIMGALGGAAQVAGGGALVLCTGGFAAPFGNALMSSGFTGLTYSLTAEDFSAGEYATKCSTAAATAVVFLGVGAVVSEVVQGAEIGARVVNVLNKNPTAANILTNSNKIIEGSQVIQVAGKGASIAINGAVEAVEYQVASGIVEGVKEGDVSESLRKKLKVENVGPAAAYGSATALIGSSIGHFQGKTLKDANGVEISGSSQGCLRTKSILYKLRGNASKQILKDLSKGIDSAINGMTTTLAMTASTGLLTGGEKLPSAKELLLNGTQAAVGGGVGSRAYHQAKQGYFAELQKKAYLKKVIKKLHKIDAKDSKEFNDLLNSTLAKKAESKKLVKQLETALDLQKHQITRHKKKAATKGKAAAKKQLHELDKFIEPDPPSQQATM